MHRKGFKKPPWGFLAVLFSCVSFASGQTPVLSLKLAGTTSNGQTVAIPPATLSLDVHLNTGGHPIEGLQFHIEAGANYSSTFTITTPPQAPFASGEATSEAASGAPATAATETGLFRSASGDYPANADYNLMTFTFDTHALGPGASVFRIVGEGFVNSGESFSTTTFATPGDYTLTVTPEPDTLVLVAAGMLLMRCRRRVRPGQA